jgi:hypothetical protein
LIFSQCLSLLLWLEERYETVYKRHPGFQKGSKPLLALDNPFPMELPENLFGEKWAFVQLPFSGTFTAAAFESSILIWGYVIMAVFHKSYCHVYKSHLKADAMICSCNVFH